LEPKIKLRTEPSPPDLAVGMQWIHSQTKEPVYIMGYSPLADRVVSILTADNIRKTIDEQDLRNSYTHVQAMKGAFK